MMPVTVPDICEVLGCGKPAMAGAKRCHPHQSDGGTCLVKGCDNKKVSLGRLCAPCATSYTASPKPLFPWLLDRSTDLLSHKEATTMPSDTPTPTNPLRKTLEIDATDAGWRLAGSQFTKLAKEPLIALLSRNLGPDDPSMRAKVAAFLDTDLGGAIVASMLSLGLGMMPAQLGDIPQKLARELRVRSMAEAGDVVADVLMEPLRQVVSRYLQGEVPRPPAALPAEASAIEQLSDQVSQKVAEPAVKGGSR